MPLSSNPTLPAPKQPGSKTVNNDPNMIDGVGLSPEEDATLDKVWDNINFDDAKTNIKLPVKDETKKAGTG